MPYGFPHHLGNTERRGYSLLDDRVLGYPTLYSTEDIAVLDKVIVERFFAGEMNWWLVEYDHDRRLGFGFVYLGPRFEREREWGYFSLDELESICVPVALPGGTEHEVIVVRDLFFEKATVREVIPHALWEGWWER